MFLFIFSNLRLNRSQGITIYSFYFNSVKVFSIDLAKIRLKNHLVPIFVTNLY
jgi:hypothetical protein